MRSFLVSLALVAAAIAHADYDFHVTQTPAGSNLPPYFGILRFNIDGAGNASSKAGISAADVVDPAGLALSPTGELFTANVNGPVSRFLVTGGGATPSGALNTGPARDVLISADGTRAYVTQGVNGNVLVFDVASGAQITTFTVPGAGALHFGSWRGSDLFLADYASGNVYDMTFDALGNPLAATFAANSATSISVAFSLDGNEMFVPGHTSGVISRFLNVGGVWTPHGLITTGVNMGDIQVVQNARAVPEPASLAFLGLGVLALKKRRRA